MMTRTEITKVVVWNNNAIPKDKSKRGVFREGACVEILGTHLIGKITDFVRTNEGDIKFAIVGTVQNSKPAPVVTTPNVLKIIA